MIWPSRYFFSTGYQNSDFNSESLIKTNVCGSESLYILLYQFKPITIKQPQIPQFQMRDNQQGHKRQGHEGSSELGAEALGQVVDGGVGVGDLVAVAHAHKTR